ncbi:MAG: hypothetical protein Q4C95_08605 [Planctomycetia bacterium]|nr:hypothetical protein [Planctomycetia bacterium]
MAINVICPGCMTRFQVSDKFAGKKGPCPKCACIIEIPKENLIVHEPDNIVSGKKKFKKGDSLRPISRSLFVFTRNQVLLSLVGILAVVLFAFLLGLVPNGLIKTVIVAAIVFGISFPLSAFGYMMVRDTEDLEIFLGNELYRRSFWVALGLSLAWLALEIILFYLNPGFYGLGYLVAVALFASFIPFVCFETDYGKGLLIFILFAFCVIFLRGLIYAPNGWIWQRQPGMVNILTHFSFSSDQKNANQQKSEGNPEASDSELSNANQESVSSTSESSKQPPKQPLSKEAPDPSQKLRRR